MTVSSSTNRVSYAGNGSTTVFPYTFKIFDQDDLTVILRAANGTETVQTITSQYTVSGVGNAGGGNVTMLTAPASGTTLVILREQDLIQELDIVPNDPFPADSLEGALDKLTFMVQQHEETLGRTIKASRTNTITGSEFTISAADRANKVFAFDGSGDVSITQGIGIYRGDWAASTAYSVRDIVKDTSTNNIFIANTAHTSSGSQPITTNTDSAKWDLLVDAAAATTSATNAAASASAASTSATNAASSASAASTSASNASTSATNAASSASAAATSATNASNSATAAAASETAAAASETAAAASETAAAASETAAAASEAAAQTAETNAETAKTAAETAATTAQGAASSATTSANAASASASSAASSASSASSSASSAASAQSAAESARDATLAAYDSFDDRYLGAKSSDPTLDNDGNALIAGSLYYNTVSESMRLYTGSEWVAAYAAGTDFVTKTGSAMTGDLDFGDNVKATFGTSEDMWIYHDGGSSYIFDRGTGNLRIITNSTVSIDGVSGGEFMAQFVSNGAVTLYFDNSSRLATTADGVDIFGTGALRLPNGTTLERPASPAAGDIRWNTTETEAEIYDGTAWGAIGGSETSFLQYEYTATAGQTTFSGADDNTATLSYTVGNLIVTLNGVVLDNGGDYTATNGTSVVLTSGAAAGDLLQVIAFKSFTVADMVPASTGGTFAGAVTLSAGGTFGGQVNTAAMLPSADATSVLGGASNRYTNLFLSGGVYLGGTTSANLLDDYEEGTWTPAFSSGTGITYGSQIGFYTKIGNVVNFHFLITWTAGTSLSTVISGLPFAVRNVGEMYPMCSIWNNSGVTYAAGRTTLIAYPNLGTTTVQIDGVGSAVNGGGPTFGTVGGFYVTGFYYTDA